MLPKAPIATPENIGGMKPSVVAAAAGVKASDVNKENIPATSTATTTRFQKTAAQTAPYIELNNVPINGAAANHTTTNNNGVQLDSNGQKNQVNFFFRFFNLKELFYVMNF